MDSRSQPTQARPGGSPEREDTTHTLGEADTGDLGSLFSAMRSGTAPAREQAWAACYGRYRQLVWTRVFYVIRTIPWLAEPREVAEDVTSDVFVGLLDAVKHYREEGKPEQWLKQVAVRTALRAKERLTGDWNRQRNRSPSGGTASVPPARRQVSFDDEAGVIAERLDGIEREELMELDRRIAALRASDDPRQQRWAEFVELYREGYGYAEIGERMGLTEGTARNWMVAIRRHLAEPPQRRSA
jgi:RNA polymerase sigma factor (sigma-70 family)